MRAIFFILIALMASAATACSFAGQEQEPTPATHRIVSPLADGEEPKEGEWYHWATDEEGTSHSAIMIITPGEQTITIYACSTIKDSGVTNNIVNVRYSSRLPVELITSEYSLQVQTTVKGSPLPVEWQTSQTQDTDIKLTGAEAQTLVQYIEETNAESYQILFPNHPELNRTIPSAGLGPALFETGTDCFAGEINEQGLELPIPPATPQEPVEGSYTYTDPDQRFTLKYPADCGQMWEATNYADNSWTCAGNPNEINTLLEVFDLRGVGEKASESPERLAKDYADNLTERYEDATRYNLITNAGNRLEVVKIRTDTTEGPVTTVAATFVDAEWHLIRIHLVYWPETAEFNEERAEASLRTFSAKHP